MQKDSLQVWFKDFDGNDANTLYGSRFKEARQYLVAIIRKDVQFPIFRSYLLHTRDLFPILQYAFAFSVDRQGNTVHFADNSNQLLVRSVSNELAGVHDGDAVVMGHSIRTDQMGVKSVLGVVPQEIALYEDLSARENLTFWGKMYGLRGAVLKNRVSEVLELIGLTDRAGDFVKKYSGGMKRRVNIGVALLHKPQVIYMDEPTVGIDPQSRRNILDSVVALKNQVLTVL